MKDTKNGTMSKRSQSFKLLALASSIALVLSQNSLAASEKNPAKALGLSQASQNQDQKIINDNKLTKKYQGVDFHTKAKPTVFKTDLRQLAQPKPWMPGDSVKVANPRHINNVADLLPPVNPVMATESATSSTHQAKAPSDLEILVNQVGFEFNGVNPPDTTGDVGQNYYIHSINGSGGALVKIYNKADGSSATNEFTLGDLASDSNCSSGLGDPVVVYDEQANRWLLSEFSSNGNKMCVYISQTDDPIAGGWYAYAFQAPSFPDYPKYSVWGDNYFVSANESGGAVYALERSKMLSGQPVTLIRKLIPGLNGFGFQSITPIDVDGTGQPADGGTGLFIRHNDDELHNSGANDGSKDFLELWTLTPDYANPANTVLQGPINIEVAEFDSDFNCSSQSQNYGCLAQKDDGSGLSTLDPLREVVNFKAQYRNFNSHESIVGTYVSKRADNSADLRWFELRQVNGNWTVYDQGSDGANDDNSRWMGGSALDGDGNMALAYISTGADRYPGVRLTGKRMSDNPGSVAEEVVLVEADGGIASDRVGDYSQMSVDPVDNCTFWFTAEQGANGGMWKTRVASFKFPGCTGTGSSAPGFTLSADNANQSVCVAGDLQPVTLTVNGYNQFADPVNFSFATLPTGFSGVFSSNPVTPGNTTNATLTVTDQATFGLHELSILADSGTLEQRSSTAKIRVVDSTHTATLLEPASGASAQEVKPTLSWNVDGYVENARVEIATDQAFTNLVAIASLNNATYYRPSQSLEQETTYFWRVVAENVCGNITSDVFNFTTRSDKDISTELVKDVSQAISGAEGSSQYFYIDLPADTASLEINTSGGQNGDDLDLYLSFDALPETSADILCGSESSSSTESCGISNPEAGTYFVITYGYSAYSDVDLMASFTSKIPQITAQNSLSFDEDQSFELTAADFTIVDGDSTQFTLTLAEGENYSLNNGTVTPTLNYNGTLSIGVIVSDGQYPSESFTATVTINPVNDAPVTADDSFSVEEDSKDNLLDVLVNDSDIDAGDLLSIDSVTTSGTGTVTIVNGKLSYTPKKDFHGSETITYQAADQAGGKTSATATVTVTKKPSSGGGSLTGAWLLLLGLAGFAGRRK